MKLAAWPLAIAAALAACSDQDRPRAQVRTQQPPRKISEPPSGDVRARPPYAIRGDGVGPYSLGEKLARLMSGLPSGPRIARIEIPGVVRTSVIRADEDAVLIGGETGGTATYIAVVGGSSIASTESNVHVGSTIEELAALGSPVAEPDRAYDPRLVVPTKLREVRFVVDQDRVAAIAVVAAPAPHRTAAGPELDCRRAPATAKAFGSCLTAAGELVEVTEDEVVVRPGEGDRPLATKKLANLLFAAPLRNPEGRDELIAIARSDDGQQRTWSITGYRFEGGKLIAAVEPETLYQVTAAQARWIGAELRDVELYLELASRPDGIEVGGLLTTRSGSRVRDVAVIASRVVARRHGKPTVSESPDAGVANTRTAPGSATGAGSESP